MKMNLHEYLRTYRPGPFKPIPYYSVIGNFVECYVADVDCYAEQVNEQLTVMRSFADNSVVGVKIYGARELIEKGCDDENV